MGKYAELRKKQQQATASTSPEPTSAESARVAGEQKNVEETSKVLDNNPDNAYRTENLNEKELAGQRNTNLLTEIERGAALSRQASSSLRESNQPAVSIESDHMNSVHNTGLRNWWNSFMNAIDEIDKARYSGEMLKYQRGIDELEEEYHQLSSKPALDDEEKERMKEISVQMAALRSNSEYHQAHADMMKQIKDIDSSPVSKTYQAAQQGALQEEMSNPVKWLAFEAPIELGGSASEMGTQIISAVGVGAGRQILTAAAAGSIGGPVGSLIGGIIGVAATLGSVGALYKMRQHESSAETFGAYEEKMQKLIGDFRAKNGRMPDENETRQLRLAAYDGLDSVYRQNMHLMAGDALDVLLMAMPWTKALNGLKIALKAGRPALIGEKLVGGALATAAEGLEEADQYGITQQYLAGHLKDGRDWSEDAMNSLEMRLTNLNYLFGKETKEWQKDAEYRNSLRSGMILGGILGGGSNMMSASQAMFNPPISTEDIKGNISQWVKPQEAMQKSAMLAKFFQRGDEVYLFNALEGLKKMQIEGATPQQIDEVIADTKEAYKFWNTLKPSGGVNASLTEKQRGQVFTELWSMRNTMKQSRTDLQDHQTYNVSDTYAKIKAEKPEVGDAIILNNKVNAIEAQLAEYEQIPADDRPSNVKAQISFLKRELKRTEEALDENLKTNNIDAADLVSTQDEAQVQQEKEKLNIGRKVIDARDSYDGLRKQLRTFKGVQKFFAEQASHAAESTTESNVDNQKDGKANAAVSAITDEGSLDIALAQMPDVFFDNEVKSRVEKGLKKKRDAAQKTSEPGLDVVAGIGQEFIKKGTPKEEQASDEPASGWEVGNPDPPSQQEGYGEKNEFFTQDKAEEARQKLKELLNSQLHSGIHPDLIVHGVTLAGYHIEAGTRKFADFTKVMIGDLGDDIHRYLKYLYNAYRDHPDAVYTEEMDSREYVEGFDVDSYLADKTTENPTIDQVKDRIDQLADKAKNSLAEMTDQEFYEMMDLAEKLVILRNQDRAAGFDEEAIQSTLADSARPEIIEELTRRIPTEEDPAKRKTLRLALGVLMSNIAEIKDPDANANATDALSSAIHKYNEQKTSTTVSQMSYVRQNMPEDPSDVIRTTLKQTEGYYPGTRENPNFVGLRPDGMIGPLFAPLRDADGNKVVAKSIPGNNNPATFEQLYTTDPKEAREGSPQYFAYVPETYGESATYNGTATPLVRLQASGDYARVKIKVKEGDSYRNITLEEAGTIGEMYAKQVFYERPGAESAVPITDIYATVEEDSGVKTLLVNTPIVQAGDAVTILHEPDWPYWTVRRGDKNYNETKILNVYRAQDINADGTKKNDVKPLATIPSDFKINEQDTLTAKLRYRFRDNESPLRTTIAFKSDGFNNIQYDEEGVMRGDIENVSRAWTKDEKGNWSRGKTFDPVFAIGYSANEESADGASLGTIVIDNFERLTEEQQAAMAGAERSGNFSTGTVYVMVQTANGTYQPAPMNRRKLRGDEVAKVTAPGFISKAVFNRTSKDRNHYPGLSDVVPTRQLSTQKTDAGIILRGFEWKDKRSKTREGWTKYGLNLTSKGLLVQWNENEAYEFQVNEKYDNISRLLDENFVPSKEEKLKVRVIDMNTGLIKKFGKTKDGRPQYFFNLTDAKKKEQIRQKLIESLSDMYMNVDSNRVNTSDSFADPFTGRVYEDGYYQYLKENEVISIPMPAYNQVGSAQIFLDLDESTPNVELTETQGDTRTESEQKIDTQDENLEKAPNGAAEIGKAEELGEVTETSEPTEGQVKDKKPAKQKFKPVDPTEGIAFRLRREPAPGYQVMTAEEIEWVRQTVGPDGLSVAKAVDRVVVNGKEAWGYFHNALTRLAEYAEAGTGFHEAFHHVFRMALTPEERIAVLQDARAGNKRYAAIRDDAALEEAIAEDFRMHMLTKRPPRSRLLKRVFRLISRMVDKLVGRPVTFDNFFRDVAEGNYFGFELRKENEKFVTESKPPRLIKTDNIQTYTHQRILIDHARFVFSQFLHEEAGGQFASKKSIDAIITDSEAVNDIMDRVHSALAQEIQELEQFIDRTDDEVAGGQAVWKVNMLSDMLADENWNSSGDTMNPLEGFRDLVLVSLRGHGFTVKLRYQEAAAGQASEIGSHPASEGDKQEAAKNETGDNLETARERIHDQEIFMRSKKETMSSGLRQAMSFIPKYKVTRDGPEGQVTVSETEFEMDAQGWPQLIDFDDLYSKVALKLVDVPHELMQDKMKRMAYVDDDVARLNYYLEQRKYTGDGFYSSFYSFFANTQYGFLVVDAGKRGEIRVIESNRADIKNTLRNDWQHAAKIYLDPTVDGEEDTINTKLGKELDVKISRLIAEKPKRDRKTGELNKKWMRNLIKETNDVLRPMGIVLDDRVWAAMMESPDPHRSWMGIARGTKSKGSPSIRMMTSALAVGRDIFVNETPSLNRLVNLQRDFETDIYTGTFINGANNAVYSVNLESYHTMKIARLLHPDTAAGELERYKGDEFYMDKDGNPRNLILKTAMNPDMRDTLRFYEFDSYKSRRGDTKEYTDTSNYDAFTVRYAMFAGSQGSTYYTHTGTKSDKSRSQWLKTKRLDVDEVRREMKNVFAAEAARIRRVNAVLAAVERMKSRLNAMPERNVTERNAKKDYAAKVHAEEQKANIKNYTDNAGKFWMFKDAQYVNEKNEVMNLDPDFHAMDMETMSPEQREAAENQIEQAIDNLLQKVFDANLQEMAKIGLINYKKTPDGKYDFSEKSTFGETMMHVDEADMRSFIYNDFIWGVEISRFVNGDFAFYKVGKDNNTPLTDYFKRGYQSITPGSQPYISDQPSIKATRRTSFTAAIVNDVVKVNETPYLTTLAQMVDPSITEEEVEAAVNNSKYESAINTAARARAINIARSYAEANKTDGQAWCSMDFYRDLSMGMNRWSDRQEEFWLNAWSKDITIEEALEKGRWTTAGGTSIALDADKKQGIRDSIFKNAPQPLKPFYWGERAHRVADQEMLIFEQLKCSIMPLTRDFVNTFAAESEVNTSFTDLYERVTGLGDYKGQPIDVMLHDSAVKVGIYGTVNSDNLANAVVREMPMRNLRFPQNIDAKEKDAINAGSQEAKILIGNMDPDATYNFFGERTGAWMKQAYHDGWFKLIKESAKRLKRDLGLKEGGVTDWSLPTNYRDKLDFFMKLRTILKETNLERDLPENYDEVLKIINSGDEVQFAASLDFPPFARRYEDILMSIFRNRILRQKMPGKSMVQIADYGTKTSDELKFIRKEGNKIVGAQVAIPFEMAKKVFGDKIKPGKVEDILATIEGAEAKAQFKKAMKILGYRIPTQGKNSMLPMEISHILPPSAGMSMVVPGEITVQQGSDFDIDKMYLMFPNLKADAEGNPQKVSYMDKLDNVREMSIPQIQNMILDMHFSILLSDNHIAETIDPLDSSLMDEKIASYARLAEKKGVAATETFHHFGSGHSNVYFESLNKFAKTAVGATANAITGQTFYSSIDLRVTQKKNGNNKFNINLVQRDKDGKKARSEGSFGRIETFGGALISDSLKMLNNAALDNAKDPKLGLLNLNQVTLGHAMLFLNAGYDMDVVLDYMNQPVMRAYAQFHINNNKRRVSKFTIGDFIASIGDEFADAYARAKDEKVTITHGILKNNLGLDFSPTSVASMDATQMEQQARILADFLYYDKAAFELGTLNRLLSPETAGNMSSFAALEKYHYDISNAIGTWLTMTNDPFSNPKVAGRTFAFYQHGWRGASKFFSNFYPYTTEAYQGVKTQIAMLRGDELENLTRDELARINGMLGLYSLLRDTNLHAQFDPEKWKTLLFDPQESLLAKIQRAQKRLKKAGVLDKNYLLRELRPIAKVYQNAEWVRLIAFNNTARRNSVQKNRIKQVWESMLRSKDPELREIAELLPVYSILVAGFQAGPFDFTELVPVSFWENAEFIAAHDSFKKTSIFEDPLSMIDAARDIMLNDDELIPEVGLFVSPRSEKLGPKITTRGAKGNRTLLKEGENYGIDFGDHRNRYAIRWVKGTNSVLRGITGRSDVAKIIKIPHEVSFFTEESGRKVSRKYTRNRYYELDDSFNEIDDKEKPIYLYKEIKGQGELYRFYHMESAGLGESYYPRYQDDNILKISRGVKSKAADQRKLMGKSTKEPNMAEIAAASGQSVMPPVEGGLTEDAGNSINIKDVPADDEGLIDRGDAFAQLADPDKEYEAMNKETGEKVGKFLSNLGVKVSVVENMEEQYGVDANGVADIANRTIDIARGDAGWNSLPEEAAHFYVEGLSNQPAMQELISQVDGTEEYTEVQREYGALYNNDDFRLRKEAATKIIANRIIREQNMGTLERILNRVKRVIMRIFGKADPFETAALQILRGDVRNISLDNKAGLYYQLPGLSEPSTDMVARMATGFELTDDTMQFIQSDYNSTFGAPADLGAQEIVDLLDLETISKMLGDEKLNPFDKKARDKALRSMIAGVNSRWRAAKAVGQADKQYAQRLRELKNALDTHDMAVFSENLQKQANRDLSYVDRELEKMVTDTSHYEGRLKKLDSLNNVLALYSHIGTFLDIVKGKITAEKVVELRPLAEALERATGAQGILSSRLVTQQNRAFADLMEDRGNSGMTREDIIDTINSSNKDISFINRMLFAMADSTDKFLSFIGAEMARVAQKARRNFITYLRGGKGFAGLTKLDEALRKHMKGKKPYDQFMVLDEKADKWRFVKEGDAKYNAIMALDEKHPVRAYYEGAVLPYVQERQKLPPFIRGGSAYNIPVIRSEAFETKKPKTYFDRLVDRWRVTGEEDVSIRDEQGVKLSHVRYRYNGSNVASSDVSMEITTSLAKAMKDIYESNEKKLTEPLLKTAVNLIRQREYAGKQVMWRGENVSDRAQATRKMVNMIEAFLYDVNHDDVLVSFPVPLRNMLEKVGIKLTEDDKLSLTKTGYTLKSAIGFINLGFNIVGQVVNPFVQIFFMFLEALAGRHYNLRDLGKALARMVVAGPKMAADYHSKNPRSKEALMMERLGLFSDGTEHDLNILYNKSGNFMNNFVRKLAYMGFKLGNAMTQPVVAFAMMDKVKFKTSKGTLSYYEAWERSPSGVLKLNSEVAAQLEKQYGSVEEGIFRTEAPIKRETVRISDAHDIEDRGEAQNTMLGSFVMMHRSWLGPLALNLFGAHRVDPVTGKPEQGFVTTMLELIWKMVRNGDVNMLKMMLPWSKMLSTETFNPFTGKAFTEEEIALHKGNLKKAYAMTAFTLISGFALADDDREEEWAKEDPFLFYTLLRIRSEILALLNPKDLMRIAGSPTAAMTIVDRFIDLGKYHIWWAEGSERLDSGFYKGWSRRTKAYSKVIPVFNQWLSHQHLEDRIKFLKR